MTFRIELEEIEVLDAIYNLRRMARYYRASGDYRNDEKCSLLAFRIENQQRAQYDADEPQNSKNEV